MTIHISQKAKRVAYKTLNIIATLALLANVTTAGFVAVPQVAHAASGNPIYAWDRTPNPGWSHGQISGYFEGEDIPFQLELNGLTAGVPTAITVQHDFIRGGVTGIETFRHPNAPTDESSITFNADRLPFTMSAATLIPGDPSAKSYTFTFTPTGTTASLYWDALIAIGAHNYPGASLDVRFNQPGGDKTVPITTREILYHDLAIEKSDNPDPILIGTTTTYTVTGYNNGKTNGGETNFTITDTLPAGMAYVNGSASVAPTSVVGNVITWNFGTVDDGDSRTVSYDATGIIVGTHDNTAVLTTDGAGPENAIEPTTVYGKCELELVKSVDKTDAKPGDTLTYTLKYKNTGDVKCTGGGVRIDDLVPAGTTYVNGSNTQTNANDVDGQSIHFGYAYNKFGAANPTGFNGTLLSWNAHVVSPGESGTVTFQVTVNDIPYCTEDDIFNKGHIYSNEIPNGVQSNEVKTHIKAACEGSLKVKKYVDSGTATPDQWSFTVGNTTLTPAPGTNYVVFTGLAAGTYTATESSIPGYHQVSTTCSNVSVVPNQQAVCEFHNARDTGDLRIKKYNDLNGNGQKDSGEPYMIGWDFTVSQAGQTVVTGTTNVGDGNYLIFTDLPTGQYQVTETPKAGWINTEPGVIPITKTVTINKNQLTSVWFGNFELGKISGYKFEDKNSNGTWDQGEPALSGWEIKLDNGSTTTTNGNGYYEFTNLGPNTYSVTETQQAGWVQTTTNPTPITITSGKVVTDVNFGNFHGVTIKAYKYEDLNGNGVLDAGEPPIQNWKVYLDGGQEKLTDANGMASWVVTSAGTYTVSEELKAGWLHTNPASVPVSVVSGDATKVVKFLNYEKPSIKITKKFDTDGNLQTTGDQFIKAGWTLELWKNGIKIDTQVTGANGSYTWDNLMPGTYTVKEIVPAGYINLGPNSYTFTAYSGGTYNYTFYNFQLGKISGYKYEDKNGNGTWDQGEPALQGWTIYLNGGQFDVTDANGYYEFSGLAAGTYNLTEDIQAGWVQKSAPSPVTITTGTDSKNNNFGNIKLSGITAKKLIDADGFLQTANDQSAKAGWTVELWKNGVKIDTQVTGANGMYTWSNLLPGSYVVKEVVPGNYTALTATEFPVTITSGDSKKVTFINFEHATIKAYKYNDLNGNGQLDQGEPAIKDWKVYLNGGNMKLTDANGMASWTITQGGTYTVSEENRAGWIHTNAASVPVTVSSGSTDTVKFLNFKLGKISGYKFNDLNGNGTWDNGEPALQGWTIYISGNWAVSTQTDANGYYEFTGLTAGNWTITENEPAGWLRTTANPAPISITSGKVVKDVNFGNFKLGKIAGYKFNDLNGNGTWDQGEPALQGWTINLSTGPSTVTDPNGYYQFTGLTAGNYDVTETQQAGWTQTTANPATINVTSGTYSKDNNFGNFKNVDIKAFKYNDLNGNGVLDPNEPPIENWKVYLDGGQEKLTNANGMASWTVTTGGTYAVSEETVAGWTHTNPKSVDVQVQSGDQAKIVKFLNFKNVSISGQKFEDTNGNGVKDAGELGLENWTIELRNTNDVVLDTTLTDQDGNYSFNNLGPGTYRLREVQQAGWHQTTTNPADVTVVSGQDVKDLDFGNFAKGKISGYKFDDLNGDGIWDQGEPAIQSWTIYISGNWAVSTQTDANGYYEFDGLNAGDWTVTEDESNTAWTRTTANPAPITITSGKVVKDVNFGNFKLGIITGYKFEDINNNGVWDHQTENGLAGWEINLWDDNGGQPGQIIDTTVTNQFGQFQFTGLTAGTYWLSETLKPGWFQYAPVSGVFGPIVITSGYDNNSQEEYFEFGNAEKITLELDKYNDQQVDKGGDGILETTETISYHIDWGVAGNSIATNVVLTDIIPAELDLNVASISNGGVWDANTRTITWDFGTQQPFASGFVTYDATLFVPVDNGTQIINVARISADNSDPQFVEDESDVTVESAPILNIVKSVDLNNNLTFVNPGDTVTYTVEVWNTGTEIAYNTMLSDLLPDGFTYVGSGLSTQEWSLGDLIPGDAPALVTYDVIVSETQLAGFYDNLATTWADNHGSLDDIATVEVRVPTVLSADPELVIEKTVAESFINPGDTVTYTVVVKNIGEATAFDVMLQDVLPAGFSFDTGAITNVWELGDINPEESKTVTYTVNTDDTILAGDYQNIATTWADNHDKISDSATVPVRIPVVLGEELPVTGGSFLYWIYLLGAAMMLIAAGYVLKLTSSRQK